MLLNVYAEREVQPFLQLCGDFDAAIEIMKAYENKSEAGITLENYNEIKSKVSLPFEQTQKYLQLKPNLLKIEKARQLAAEVQDVFEMKEWAQVVMDFCNEEKKKYDLEKKEVNEIRGIIKSNPFHIFLTSTKENIIFTLPAPANQEQSRLGKETMQYIEEFLAEKAKELGTRYRKTEEHGLVSYVFRKPESNEKNLQATMVQGLMARQGNYLFNTLDFTCHVHAFMSTHDEPVSLDEIIAETPLQEQPASTAPESQSPPATLKLYDMENADDILRRGKDEKVQCRNMAESLSLKEGKNREQYQLLEYIFQKAKRGQKELTRGEINEAYEELSGMTLSLKQKQDISNRLHVLVQNKLVKQQHVKGNIYSYSIS